MKWAKARYGICVHCLRHTSKITRDHVFPKAWYPETARADLPKWQIPACVRCNNAYSRLEQDLLIRLAACVDPTVAETAGIWQRALRSMDPNEAGDPRDAAHRIARRQKLERGIIRGLDIPTQGIFPGLGERWSRAPEDQVAVFIPRRYFRKLTEKIVRGIYYLADGGRLIAPPYLIEHYVLDDRGAAPLTDLLDKHGQDYAHEPGILVRRAVVAEDPRSGIFSIEVWKSFKLFAVVTNPCLEENRFLYRSVEFSFRLPARGLARFRLPRAITGRVATAEGSHHDSGESTL